MKVLVGMSGGVDSAVAAILMKQAGHEVTGIMMSIWDGPDNIVVKRNACYGPDEKEDVEEAGRICHVMGIPFRVFDCAKEYRETVLSYFRDEYLSARTPNPCVKCNHLMKFGVLLEAAEKSGLRYDTFATGHYARVGRDQLSGRYFLKKAADKKKDQSYFLYRLSQEQLSKVAFPLGELSKVEVRSIARAHGLHVSEKEESQDFYSGDYKELLNTAAMSGDIVMTDGTVVGRHVGLWNYTPGQRKGLGVAYSEPLYVVSLDGETNRVVVGKKEKTLVSEFTVKDLCWNAIEGLDGKREATIRTRSNGAEETGIINLDGDDTVTVRLESSKGSVSPGQSAVFYDGDMLLGGGIIDCVIHE